MSREDGNIYMGIGQKNPDFRRPDPVNPDDGGGDSPIPQHIKDNGVVIGLVFTIILVTCLICALLYKKK